MYICATQSCSVCIGKAACRCSEVLTHACQVNTNCGHSACVPYGAHNVAQAAPDAGYNVCIFAYGQTGSGKTHTMAGTNIEQYEGRGINYRALDDLFALNAKRQDEVCHASNAIGPSGHGYCYRGCTCDAMHSLTDALCNWAQSICWELTVSVSHVRLMPAYSEHCLASAKDTS